MIFGFRDVSMTPETNIVYIFGGTKILQTIQEESRMIFGKYDLGNAKVLKSNILKILGKVGTDKS